MQFGCRKSERYANVERMVYLADNSIRKGLHRMRGRLLRAYTNPKSADSSFSILTKLCQKIRPMGMRKGQKSSALLGVLDRALALQG